MKSQRSLQTILFTDLIGSTEKAAALGDRAWRELLERHHAIVRDELRRWGGREVTEAGDGFLALFENPAQAIVCAAAIRDRLGDLGLGVRCGIHMGQLESQAGGSAGGIAVHIGARVAGHAGAGEVLVTSAVRDAESGSGFEFEDLGRHALKGVDREWQLFRVTGLPVDVSGLEPGAWRRIADRVRSRPLVAALVALLFLALGGYALWRLGPGAAVASEIRSLAVLPLENHTGDPEQEYFVDGMTDAMITELSKLGSVKVISRKSAMSYRDTDKPLKEIADDLGVDGVVEGSVARSGDRVRITAQLVHAETDAHVWADAYDGDFSDVLLLQSDVARDIAREIAVTLTPQAETLLAATDRVDPETYEAYLRGMYQLNKSTPEDFRQGIAYLEEAVERDPGNARAYAGLATGYITLAHGPDPADVRNKAREAAERAIKLDPDLAEAHSTLAAILTYFDWDWEAAEREYKRANELDPNLAMNRYHYAWYLALFDRLDEAIEEHKRAQALDPLTPLHTAWLGELYNMAGRYDDAIAEARKTLEMDDGNAIGLYVTGMAYLGKGMVEEAVEAHEAAVAVNPNWRFALAGTYLAAGRRADAQRILRELEAEEVSSFGAFQRAWLNTVLGDVDEAFRWLDYEPHHAWVAWVRLWPPPELFPEVDRLRKDPRFQDLMARMRLPMPATVRE
ncbi:MAG: hypothetical protein ACREK7_09360 [Gemmatimonadota bacterium]